MMGFWMVEERSIFEEYYIFTWLAILSKTIPNPKEKCGIYKMAAI